MNNAFNEGMALITKAIKKEQKKRYTACEQCGVVHSWEIETLEDEENMIEKAKTDNSVVTNSSEII